MFNNFEDAKNWIENIKRFTPKMEIDRVKKALDYFDHPEFEFKSIHVAGTNGKGSTTNYIKNILQDAGYKVGIYTSPYVVMFNERIGYDDNFITDNEIVEYANIIYPYWKETEGKDNQITFFEILTVMAFMYYRDKKVDFAVIEVGLGGTLDATNVIVPEVSVITNISYDHMKQLGDTLESIALNKLGIVKPQVPLITSVENKKLFPLFYEITAKSKSHIKIIDFNVIKNIRIGETTKFIYGSEEYVVKLIGYHQVKNAVLAIEVIRHLRVKLNLKITKENIKAGLLKTKWPGRFEIFNKNIVLDGAHNIGGILSLKKTVEKIYADKYIKCLFCVMDNKEHQKIIEELDNFCDELYFTEIEYERSANAEKLFAESHHYKKSFFKNYKEIFSILASELKDKEILLVTGSLYFISAVRRLLVK